MTTTLTWQSERTSTPRVVAQFLGDLKDSDEMKLAWHWLLARNPYVGWEPSYEQVCRDFDRWLRQRPRPKKRSQPNKYA